MAHNAGKANEHEISASLDIFASLHDDFWGERIPDTRSYIRINPKITLPKRPADFIAVYQGTVFFLEAKSSHNKTSYGKSFVADHQIQTGKQIVLCGGRYYFLIVNRSTPRNFRCFAITPFVLEELFMDTLPRKSVKWAELEEIASFELQRLSGSLWDLEPLFQD